MFEVVCSYPFDGDFEDDRLIDKAGFGPSWSGCGACEHGGTALCGPAARRELGWVSDTFDEARQLKLDLESVYLPGLHVTMRETSANGSGRPVQNDKVWKKIDYTNLVIAVAAFALLVMFEFIVRRFNFTWFESVWLALMMSILAPIPVSFYILSQDRGDHPGEDHGF